MAKMHPARPLIFQLLAAGLLAAHLLVVGMAMSPALHHWLHGDAGASDHHCAATAMIDGQLDRADAPVPGPGQPPCFLEMLAVRQSLPPAIFSLTLPGGRAPPIG